jgi:hypothetical protein
MATSSIILDIRANTQRALSEFKTFSSQLDNKFLVSGLKLDVVRNALSQINREFQKSLGEQGLASAQSLKAAENQASILTNIYAGFSKTASGRIVEDFSSALNLVATRTGSTVSDIQKTLAVSPYLSRDFSQGIRQNILVDIQNLQTAARRAGLGGNTADILNKFLTGQTGGQELQESGDTLSKMLGAELSRVGGGVGTETMSLAERTRILRAALANIDIEGFAKETGGFRAVLEQFSASLFNPKAGLLGAMREFVLKTGEAPTTIFKETTKLFESIFGEEGFIKTLSRELAKAFGLRGEDTAIRFLGRGIRFITNLINGITNLIDDILNIPIVRKAAQIIRSAFDGIVGFLKNLENVANNPPDFPDISKESIQTFIKEIGENVRGFLRKVGAFIRGEDISDEAGAGASIIGTIVDEAGNTMLTFFREVGDALLAKTGTIALELAKVLPGTIAGIIGKGLTGAGGITGFILSALGVGGLGLGASRAFGGFRRGVLAGEGGVAGAANRFLGSPFGPLRPRARVTGSRVSGGGGAIPPGLDDLISSVRGTPDRYSLDPMFQNIRETNELNRFNQEFAQSQRQFRDREFFQRQFVRGQYSTSLGGFQMEGPMEIGRYGSQYRTPIGPLPHGSAEPWTMANDRYQPYMGQVNEEAILEGRRQEIARRQAQGRRNPFTSFGRDLIDTSGMDAISGQYDRGRGNVAARFNRRYGSGGTRGVLGRRIGGFGTRIGGAARGIGSYYRGGGGTGVTGLLGAGIALGGTMLGEGVGGEAGENITAFSQIGGGVLSGASTGAMIGSIIPGIGTAAGAVIGGVIGGIVPFMDKGVRDAVGRFIGDIGKTFSDGAKSFADTISGGIKSIQGGWNSVVNTAQDSIMNLLPKKLTETLKFFTEEIPKKLKEFASNLGTSMLDSVKNFNLGKAVLDKWEEIKSGFMGQREVGGPVIRGTSYIVGERGPEIFTPGQSGNILTNRELNSLASRASSGSSGGSNVSFNITINATGLAGNDIAAAIQPAVMQVLDTAWSRSNSNIVTRGATVI